MRNNDTRDWVLLLLCTLALVAARMWLLPHIGFADYDAVKNWQIATEISSGNWQNLFHHRSPLFFLFYSVFVHIFPDFHFFIYLNLLLQVVAVLLFFDFVRQHLALPKPEQLLLLLFIGTSVFLVHSSRQFSIESPSLLLFVLLLRVYYRRFQLHDRSSLFQAVWLLALALPLNYKFLLLLPVAAVLEWRFRDGVLNVKTFFLLGLVLLCPFVVFTLLGLLVGLPVYAYAGSYIGLTHFTGVRNAAGREGSIFSFDPDYYFRYLFEFESWLLLPALLLFPLLYRRELFRSFRQISIYQFLFVFGYAFLLGMSVLMKAPRGLLFSYGIFYVFAYLVLRRLVANPRVLQLALGLAVLQNVLYLNRHIYRYASTSYPEVAAKLQELPAPKVIGTVSMNLLPFLKNSAETVYQAVETEEELTKLQAQGYSYLLLDDYYRVTNIRVFDRYRHIKPIQSWSEQSLQSPLLFLEHSEFAGLNYRRTMENWKEAVQEPVQLRLIRLD